MPIGTWVNVPYLYRLIKRFNLSIRMWDPDALVLVPSVQPVTNVDDLLVLPKGAVATLDLTGAGPVDAHIVPPGKRWTILMFARQSTTATSYLSLVIGGVTTFLTDASLLVERVWPTPFKMNEGDKIVAAGTSDAGDGARWVQLLYTEEDAY